MGISVSFVAKNELSGSKYALDTALHSEHSSQPYLFLCINLCEAKHCELALQTIRLIFDFILFSAMQSEIYNTELLLGDRSVR